jgi:tetratricopeptide (TPR) repeat protein
MRPRTRFSLACLALVFFVAAAADAARAQGGHTLEGRVQLPNGAQPTSPVKVTLTFNGRRIHETFTDLSGRFNFAGLSRGNYQLTAEGDGQTFDTTSVGAEISAFGSGSQGFTQNIQLRPKAAAAAAPAGAVSLEELDPSVPERARERYRQALREAAADKPEQAVKLFQEALAAHPPFYAAHLGVAEQHAKLQRYDDALAAYQKAGELKPDRAEPYVGIGVTLVSQKRYDEGIRLLRGVIEVDKNLAAPYLSLGYAEMMTGQHKDAETHLLRALDLAKPAIAHIYLANVYEQLGQPAKAVEHLQTYLKESPKSPQADSVRGAIDKLLNKTKKP